MLYHIIISSADLSQHFPIGHLLSSRILNHADNYVLNMYFSYKIWHIAVITITTIIEKLKHSTIISAYTFLCHRYHKLQINFFIR